MNIIALELGITVGQVRATALLLQEGATVPFIARYRKEATGTLDEVAITAIRDRLGQLEELERRRESILKSLQERGLLNPELEGKILGADTLTVLEDLYLPFRPKRRTRATMAKEKGLEPLALILFAQEPGMVPLMEATAYVNLERGVANPEEALAGARDIMAEWVSEDQTARERIRQLYMDKGVFQSRAIADKEEEGAKFRDYFDWSEPVASAPSHRILAMRRGEKEGFLDLRVGVPEEEAHAILESLFVKSNEKVGEEVRAAAHDAFKRLLGPSMETEVRLETKKRADTEAIRVFMDNLRQLLLAPALGQKRVIGVDPGIRTGCKMTLLDRQGKLLKTETIYLSQSEGAKARAASKVMEWVGSHAVEAVAVGNGTAGRETEAFLKELDLPRRVSVLMVNESGASVYSASDVARAEFPDLDVSYRGAVSIGRRLMDPLAELVKIDPKAIGVGQYQHDVNQPALKRGLDDVVMSCVNAVGVEVNTASEQLLTYISGLGPQLARAIVQYRNEYGPFATREDLKKVPRLGPKAFEQSAGFLRIKDGLQPLDASAVHPESYPLVEAMARNLGRQVQDLMQDGDLRERIDLAAYVTETVGMPTLNDILSELAKPGRDPRDPFETFSFEEGVQTLEDLRPGMTLPGVITNVTAFGAFVDVGVHQDGLVHVSELGDRFVRDPHEVVKVNQKVRVTVLEVDLGRKRISLSMRTGQKHPGKGKKKESLPPRKPTAFNAIQLSSRN